MMDFPTATCRPIVALLYPAPPGLEEVGLVG